MVTTIGCITKHPSIPSSHFQPSQIFHPRNWANCGIPEVESSRKASGDFAHPSYPADGYGVLEWNAMDQHEESSQKEM
jgi:hypothetical protein